MPHELAIVNTDFAQYLI